MVQSDDEEDELMRMASETDVAFTGFHDSNLDLNLHDGAVFSSPSSSATWQQASQQGGSRCVCCSRYPKEQMSCVWMTVSLFIILGISSLSIGLGYYAMFVLKPELVIDKSVESFSIPDHRAYVHFDALTLARRNNATRNRSRRDTENALSLTDTLPASRQQRDVVGRVDSVNQNRDERLVDIDDLADSKTDWSKRVRRSNGNFLVDSQRTQVVRRWKMQVIYLAEGDNDLNVFTEERLKMIHKIEQGIVSHPRWGEFCLRDPIMANDPAVRQRNSCAPLNSLLSYFFPSEDEHKQVFYDGFGENLGNVSNALRLAMNQDTFYYFVDTKINQTFQKSNMLRTEVLFGAPLPGFRYPQENSEQQSDMYKEFVITYIDLLSKSSTNKVRVLYGGNELFDYEVETTFWTDVRMAIYAVSTIALLMFAMTSFSFTLTFMGLWCIVLAFPLSIFFYRVVFNIIGLGIMNGAAAFVIVGIGVDDVFVFINIFRQTADLKSVTQRLKFTVRTAGLATFATSITTAVSYAANIAGSIPAVYEFGLFMSLIVAGCWINVFLIMPASLYLHYFWFQPLEDACSSFCCRCLTSKSSARAQAPQNSLQDDVSVQPTDDDDVPLLSIENEEDAPAPENDEALLIHNEPEAPEHMASTSYMGRLQQVVLSAFVDKLVIRWRYFWLILMSLFLVGSIGMATQLQVSDHPPQLFQPETNLQRLLDLKANFTMIDDLHCDLCSAMYKVAGKPGNSSPERSIQQTLPATTQVVPTTAASRAMTTTVNTTKGQLWTVTSFVKSSPAQSQTRKSHRPSTEKTTTTTTEATRRPVTPAEVPHMATSAEVAKSVGEGYDPCKDQNCNNIKSRPVIQSGATVYVVFGITGVNRTGVTQGHVLNEFRGMPTFDDSFADAFDLNKLSFEHIKNVSPLDIEHLKELCKVCIALANNKDLVKNGSAQCLPRAMPLELTMLLNNLEDCIHLPKTLTIYNHEEPSHAEAGINHNKIIWLAFAFESTVSKSESYFEAYKKYQQWEVFIEHIKKDILSPNSPLQQMFQTSEHWRKVLMEVVAVDSAVFSVVLSFVVCMCSVLIFTGHPIMLLVVFITIVALIALVVAIFWMSGWQMGAVEAVSLSILVGSSVDYCMHLAEGYLVVGKVMPAQIANGNNGEKRRWRTVASIRHIGASILSSALTTIVAAIPLTQTTIQPFAKFGKIVLINSSVAIVYTLTLCVALLATLGPATFVPTWKSHLKAAVATLVFCGLGVGIMYAVSVTGAVEIPGPNGTPLFRSE